MPRVGSRTGEAPFRLQSTYCTEARAVDDRDNGRGDSNEPQSWSLDTQRLARVFPVATP